MARRLALVGAVLAALLPLVAQGALTSTRLDWGGKAPMPTARTGLGLVATADGGLYAVGGAQHFNPLDAVGESAFEAAVLSQLPSASPGGPYTVYAGETVRLTVTGIDPEGGTLSYGLDLVGDLMYGPFQSINLTAGILGVRHFFGRVSDDQGGYAVAQGTFTVLCPRTRIQTVRIGPGQVRATLTSSAGRLSGVLHLGLPGRPLVNASVDVQGGPSGLTVAQDVPVNASQVVLTVSRLSPGAVNVPFSVVGNCGEWKSFIGFGTGV